MDLLNKISKNRKINKPIIYGLSGLELSDDEKYFFSKSGAIGFILFSRNIKNKIQVKSLVNSIKEIMDGEVLILTDQEGGRVQRLKGEDWQDRAAAQKLSDLYTHYPKHSKDLCYKNFSQIAFDLVEIGINTNCAPVLDIITPKTHQIIGDRSFGNNASQVIDLAAQVCKAFLDNGIYPVIKHIPGHGKGVADSHLELPIVNASLQELENSDFLPFIALKEQKLAMTAHILYSAIDDKFPATISSKMMDIIRQKIGFKNILMSDDISMRALSGSVASLSVKALEVGCDLILHCNGNIKEMGAIDYSIPKFGDNLLKKLND
jgi:beta-N-acetylhexosaminidase